MVMFLLVAQIVLVNTVVAPPEIEARYWFNNPEFKLHDDRQVYLLFFATADKEATAAVRKLNALARRPSHVVIGLTPDDSSEAEAFIRENKVGFTIGAGSKSAARFGVKKLPALLKIARDAPTPPEEVPLDALPDELVQDAISSLSDEVSLTAFIESDAHWNKRRDAVFQLFQTAPPAGFLDFAERQLKTESNPWVRGSLEFLAQKARGVSEQENAPAPSSRYARQFEASPDDAPQWAAAREYRKLLPARAVDELRADYWENSSSEQNEVLIRRWAVDQILKATDKPAARAAYLEMLPYEPDFFIRLRLVGELSNLCAIGDVQTADLLDELALSETNVLHVRPMMQYVSHYLRTGQEDTRTVPKPP